MNRRDALKLASLALCSPANRMLADVSFAANDIQTSDPASQFDWIHSNRTLIAEAYNPPFYPRLEYDPSKAVPIATALNCNSFRYPSASYLAYFPSQSGYPVHPELKGDPMRDTIGRLRAAGLRPIAYIPLNHPFMAIDSNDPRYPDWSRRFADGKRMISAHYGFNRYYEGCLNSPLREVIRKLILEVLSYDFDALYFDGPYEGIEHSGEFCYCEHCKSAYRKRFGASIPNQKSAGVDELKNYIEWMRDEVSIGFFREMADVIRARRHVPVLFNDTTLLTKNDQWRTRAIPFADGFMFEAADTPEQKLFNLQLGKSTGKATWTYLGNHTEYSREHLKERGGFSWFSYPVEGEELLLDGAVATASGVGCLYWGLQRFFYQPEPPASYASGRYVKETFDFQEKHQTLLRSLTSRPQAGILVSDQTINWYGGRVFNPAGYPNYFHGAFNLLKSLSFEPEPFLDWMMTSDSLKRYRMVFVPNAPCLSDAQCAMLRDYVSNGGTLVATHLTSIADEYGRVRKDFGLSDLFGASYAEPEPWEYPDLYIRTASGDTVPQDLQVMRVRATDGNVGSVTFDRGNHADIGPAVISKATGRGQCIYIASGLEAIYEETRMDSVRSFMKSILDPVLDESRLYEIDYQLGVTPHYMASDKAIVLFLLADIANQDRHQKVRQRFYPVENLSVRIRVPHPVESAVLMRSNQQVETSYRSGWVHLTVPRFVVYEAIRVDVA